MTVSSNPDVIAEAVLTVLSGTPLDETAARIGVPSVDLGDAMEVYQAAGHAALRAQAAESGWYQVRVQFADWGAAERIAVAALGPALAQAQGQGQAEMWWFIRKAPCWRLRLQPGPAAQGSMKPILSPVLDRLVTDGLAERWWETIYEPESAAFGGQTGMDIAHALFHADSCNIMDFLRRRATTADRPAIGRRELSVLLCTGMLRSAGQDWYECGDVWYQVTQLRPTPPTTPASQRRDLAGSLRRLLTADIRPDGVLFGPEGPLAFAAPWSVAFDAAGRALGTAATAGILERGVRSVLAHHVIFHWNRLGLTDRTQAILARTALDVTMSPPDRSSRVGTVDGH